MFLFAPIWIVFFFSKKAHFGLPLRLAIAWWRCTLCATTSSFRLDRLIREAIRLYVFCFVFNSMGIGVSLSDAFSPFPCSVWSTNVFAAKEINGRKTKSKGLTATYIDPFVLLPQRLAWCHPYLKALAGLVIFQVGENVRSEWIATWL